MERPRKTTLPGAGMSCSGPSWQIPIFLLEFCCGFIFLPASGLKERRFLSGLKMVSHLTRTFLLHSTLSCSLHMCLKKLRNILNSEFWCFFKLGEQRWSINNSFDSFCAVLWYLSYSCLIKYIYLKKLLKNWLFHEIYFYISTLFGSML